MLSVFGHLFAAYAVGFVVSAGVVLPFIAGREVRSWVQSAASDIRA